MHRRHATLPFLLVLVSFVVLAGARPGQESIRAVPSAVPALADAGLALRFEANGSLGFDAGGPAGRVALDAAEAWIVPRDGASPPGLALRLSGTNPEIRLEGVDPYPGRTHYLLGSDPSGWRLDVVAYRAVRAAGVYPGIDLVYSGTTRRLDMRFELAAATDPAAIALALDGIESLTDDGQGGLQAVTPSGSFRIGRPSARQVVDGVPHEIEAGFAVDNEGMVGLRLSDHDAAQPVEISFSTASPDVDPARVLRDPSSGFHLAVDPSGRAYVAGTVPSVTPGGRPDAFVGRLARDGKELESVTVIGGDGVDSVEAIAVDATGRVAIAGATRSASIPGVPETIESNGAEAFAALLAPDGRSVVWTALLGGSGSDEARALVLDRSGSAWIAGRTTSPDLAAGGTAAAGSIAGGNDLFVARLETDGTTRWISRLGGDGNDDPRSIALDSRGDVYVAGVAESASGRQAMAAKLSPDGAVTAFLRFGGGSVDEAWAIALDPTDRPVVAGATTGEGLEGAPATATIGSGGGRDAFLARLSPDLQAIETWTRLGGPADDDARSLTIDRYGHVLIAGGAGVGFPGAERSGAPGPDDAYAALLGSGLDSLTQTVFSGGAAQDAATTAVQDTNGRLWLSGISASSSLTRGEALRGLASGDHGFVDATDALAPALAPLGVCPGTRNFDGGPGGTGTAWETAANWSGDTLPTATDDVCIDGAFAVAVGSGAQNAGTLRVQGGASLKVNGGTLTLAGASEIDGQFEMNGGTLAGAGSITVSGLFTWSSGTVSGSGAFNANGGIAFDSGAGSLNGRTMTNTSASPGAIVQTGTNGYLSMSNGATFNNAAGALFEVQNENGVFSGGGTTSTFNNAGTFRRTTASGLADIQNVTFNNQSGGAVEVQSGTLQINGTTSANCGSTCAGAWKVSTGAFLSFAHSGTYTMSGPFGGASGADGGGGVTFDAGTQTLTGTYQIAGETLIQGSTVNFNAASPTTIDSLRIANGTLQGSSQINVTGLFTWSSGTVSGGPAAFHANGGIVFNSGGVTLSGRTMNHTSTTVPATLQTGTSASLALANAATFNNAAGALFEVQNDQGVFTGGGTTSVFNNAGTFRRTTASGVADIQNVTFNNQSGGAVEVQSGTLQINGTTSANCGSTCAGAWKVSTGAFLSFAHSGTYTMSGPFGGASGADGGGSVTFDNGTQTLTGTYQFAGETLVQGSTVNFSSASPTTIDTLRIVNGTLQGSSQISVTNLFTWSGGTVAGGPAVFNANGGILLNNSTGTLSGRTMNHTSTSVPATIQTGTNGNLSMANGATFHNGAGALFEVQNDNGIFSGGGTTSVFNNAGTFRRTTASGVADIQNVTFNNQSGGAVEVQSGTLQINGTTSATCGSACPGAWKVSSGAALSFNHSGTYVLSGPFGGATGAEGGGDVAFDSGTQTLTGTYQIAGETLVQGSTVNFSAASPTTIDTLRIVNGTLQGSSQINVTNLFTWSGGTVAGGPAVFNANGGIVFNNTGTTLSGRTLNHTSATVPATIQAGTGAWIYLANAATFHNAAGARFEVQNDQGVFNGGGATSVFNNAGTFRRTTSSGVADIQSVTFNNQSGGSVEVQSGTLQINGTTSATCGSNCPGAWKVATGATMSFAHSGTYVLSGPFGGATEAEGGGNVTFDAGTQTLTGTYQIAGETLIAGSMVNFSAPSPTTIAELRMTSGTLQGSSAIGVTGLFTWGSGTVAGGPAAFSANGGILANNSFCGLDGRTMNHTSPSVPATLVNGTGAYLSLANGATFNNVAGALFVVENDNGVFAGGGATSVFNNAGTFRRTTSSGLADIQSVTFNNPSGGVVDVQSGTLQINGTTSATCGSACAGAWRVGASAILSFQHNGTYVLSGPFGGATPAEGGGSVIFAGGTQNLTGTYQIAGETLVSGSSVNFSAASPTTIASLRMTTGTLGGSSAINLPSLFTWSSGVVTGGPATFNANGGILFDNSAATLDGRTLNHTSASPGATIAAQFAYLSMVNGAVFNNAAGALFDVQNDQGIFQGGGTAPLFANAGTFRRTTGAGTAFLNVNFTNSGAVQVQSGKLNAQVGYTQTAGSTTVNAGAVLDSNVDIALQGGVLAGTGTVEAPLVNNSGGQVAPGPSSGILTLVGDYVQGSNGGFTVEIGGLTAETQYDVFAITNPGFGTGDASLGGALNVSLISGFDPAIGDSFTILTSDTRAGQFATTNLPAFGCGKTWNIVYGATSVVLQVVAQPGTANLGVTNTDAPDPIAVGSSLTYTVTVSNAGPDSATNTTLTDTLPAGATFVSATPSQGTCSHSSGTVTCNLGTIANGASVVTTIVVTPTAPGTITNSATAASAECDPSPGNETNIQTSTEVKPACADTDNDGFAVCDASCLPSGGDQCGDCKDTVASCTTDCSDNNGNSIPDCEEVCPDADNDGFAVCDGFCALSPGDQCGDCNDASAAIKPGAAEITGDGVDQNCDGVETCFADADNDGYRPNTTATVASADTDCSDSGEAVSTDPTGDCNDTAAAINPGATEIAGDGIDQNCDGAETCFADADNDTYRPDGTATVASTDADCADSGEAVSTDPIGDCNDTNAAINPGATEITGDGVDQNCDGTEVCFVDADDDTYRPNATATVASADVDCADSGEAVSTDPTGDCNDANAAIKPGATEIAGDGVDQNCDGAETCFTDADNDGYRPNTTATTASADTDCADSGEAVSTDPVGDCNDSNPAINPAAAEACNGIDDNCDNTVPANEADADGDGVRVCAGDCDDTIASCTTDCSDSNGNSIPDCAEVCPDVDGDNFAVCDGICNLSAGDQCGDCNDANAAIKPGVTEVTGDGVDQNCDGTEVCFADADNDTYRPNGTATVASADTDCSDSAEAVSTDPTGDCNDSSAAINPGATEITGDGIDQNCDGAETCFADADNDTYRPNGTATVASTDTDCADSGEAVSTDPIGDCNDTNAAINPGATEITGDGVDQNCNGTEVCFVDADDDTYRPNATATVASADVDCADSGEAASADPTGDCNDANAAIKPGATEIAGDGVDQNCDGAETCFADADNDGYRPNATATVASTDLDCVDSGEAVSTDPTGDCNDTNAAIKPGATEIAGDGVDQNCDGAELCYRDADDDGYRPDPTSTVASADVDCQDAGEAAATDPTGDCNEANPAINPGATETGTAACNDEIDNDCDNLIDAADLLGCGLTTNVCEDLGDAPAPLTIDQDAWLFQGHEGENVSIQLAASEGGSGRVDLILIDEMGTAVNVFQIDRSQLPNTVTATLSAAGPYRVVVQEQPAALLLPGNAFRGAYCLTFEGDLGAAPSLAPTSSVESASGTAARRTRTQDPGTTAKPTRPPTRTQKRASPPSRNER